MNREHLLWTALATGAAVGASIAARHGAAAVWRHARNEEPPVNPASARASVPSILIWATLSGVCVALARTAGYGVVHEAWRKALGRRPPS